MPRYIEIRVVYKSDEADFNVNSSDFLVADDLISLLVQFNMIIAQLHRRILNEELSKVGKLNDDNIPF